MELEVDDAYQKLKDMGLTLPPAPRPDGNYIPAKIHGDVLYLAGQGPRGEDGRWLTGKVGKDLSWEEGYEHAKMVGLQLLGVASNAAGGLHRLEVIKVFGMVNAAPDFRDHPKVINGCSDLFVAVLGKAGQHARSAVGMGSLPNGMTVEIEAILRILPESP